MSRSFFMLKMLENERNKGIQQPLNFANSSNTLKKIYSEDQNKCRICLRDKGSIPIYGTETNLPEAIKTISGVEVSKDDQYPKHLCLHCHSLLRGAILFRKSAQKSEEILRHHQQALNVTKTATISEDCSLTIKTETAKQNIHKCKTCKEVFETSEALKFHKKTKKHKNVRIQCRICTKLLTPKLYEKHLARHRSASHLVCDVCGKLYRKDNLLRHLQLHSNSLPFQCQVCPYRGRFMESLKIHMRTHSGDKPFTCDKCELKFITRSNLNRHLLTHEKEKPFQCVECKRGFYLRRDLDVHLKADHAGIKEFNCRLCGNKYGTKKALMRHELRVHNRIKMAKGRMPLYLQAEFQSNTN